MTSPSSPMTTTSKLPSSVVHQEECAVPEVIMPPEVTTQPEVEACQSVAPVIKMTE